MFRNQLNKLIKSNNEEGQVKNKKTIENLVFFVIILIITIVIINIIWNGKKQTTKQESNNSTTKQLAETEVNETSNSTDLSVQLEEILSKIQGVGEVKVFVNYSESSQIVAMYNETTKSSNTEESDTSGGTRKIQEIDSQKDII